VWPSIEIETHPGCLADAHPRASVPCDDAQSTAEDDPLSPRLQGRRRFKRDAPYDYRTVEQQLELDDTTPDDSRYYAVMVATGWIALACAFLISILLTGIVVYPLFGDQIGHIVVTVFEAVFFFCLAGAANAMGRMAWYVPQARGRLRKHGADSEAFRKVHASQPPAQHQPHLPNRRRNPRSHLRAIAPLS
jgi:hypothetical protein